MNKRESSRALLLEHLERRCMLAGNGFAESLGNHHDEHRSNHDHGRERSAVVDVRGEQNRDQRFRYETRDDDLRGRHRKHENSQRNRAVDPRAEQTSTQAQVTQVPTILIPRQVETVRIVQITIVTPVESLNRSANENLSGGQTGGEVDNRQAEVTRTAASSTTQIIDLNSGVHTEDSDPSSGTPQSLVSEKSEAVEDQMPANNGSPSIVPDSSREFATVTANANPVGGAGNTDSWLEDESSRNHAIDLVGPELFPWLQSESTQNELSSPEIAWELDDEALQKLRELAREQIENVEANQAVDNVIATWFGAPTGLIDDIRCQKELPSMLQETLPTIGDIVLEATIGHHRTVSVIASASAEQPSSVVRDAVLAAIAEEQSKLILEAIPGPIETRISGLTYPGAAIVATLALSARRRRNAMMESTQ